jgi:hypothetical protein
VIGLKRVALLLVVALLAGAVVVQSAAGAAGPGASASKKKCKGKHGAKKKHKRKCKKKKKGTTPPAPTTPTTNTSALTISPVSWNFGSFPIGLVTAPKQFTVTNSAASSSGPLSTSISGANPGNYSISGDGCTGKALGPGSHCSLFVSCVGSGTVPATFNANLAASANPGGTREAPLTCSQI